MSMNAQTTQLDPLAAKLDRLVDQLSSASRFAKVSYQGRVLDCARRVLVHPDGLQMLQERAAAMERAGVFTGTDWENPAALLPRLVGNTLSHAEPPTIVLECLSLLRLLSAAQDEHAIPSFPAENARHFLTQVLALNLDRLFGVTSEATRAQAGPLSAAVDRLLAFLLDRIGAAGILGRLVDEIWRILAQRPLQVDHVKAMILQIALAISQRGENLGEARLGADRLISALFGPTHLCREDPGLDAYRERLAAADARVLHTEASGMARAMLDTGLVSDYHAALLGWIMENRQTHLLPEVLGLSSTGVDALRCYEPLIHRLITDVIRPGTTQAVLGLSMMLERGILYSPPIAPSLWRLIQSPLSPACERTLQTAYGTALPAKTHLLAGMLMLLGQPLGIGQGNNPTCQSARALSMWALNDPDYLFWLVANATCNDRIVMHFEGQPLDSAVLPLGLASHTPLDADPVSTILLPHLDRIYAEMGRRTAERGEDPHKWINPELHGWWVGRNFHIAVDVATGKLAEHARFLRDFHASYHPLYNGNQPVIHPQPAGIAVTDSNAGFIGWHAISIVRVALDQTGTMRVYFFNPNNDSGQDWGKGIVVSTHGHGERFGEGSLPFGQFASRLYIFHDDGLQGADGPPVPDAEIDAITEMARESWARDR
ncbi:hypothetical protein [Pararhodobacter sp. SW119]|uniref:hypothetical protein n=1 Tax=Pararhodobacter sp. SW119 TaxID=2780075 RepID=UPI001AE01489|nr:hypothetical protein [Pararhodobacter sp. SW119]